MELALRDGITTSRYGAQMAGGLEVRIMVLGTGRGPLIRAALATVDKMSIGIATGAAPFRIVPQIIGVEKNPLAAL